MGSDSPLWVNSIRHLADQAPQLWVDVFPQRERRPRMLLVETLCDHGEIFGPKGCCLRDAEADRLDSPDQRNRTAVVRERRRAFLAFPDFFVRDGENDPFRQGIYTLLFRQVQQVQQVGNEKNISDAPNLRQYQTRRYLMACEPDPMHGPHDSATSNSQPAFQRWQNDPERT